MKVFAVITQSFAKASLLLTLEENKDTHVRLRK